MYLWVKVLNIMDRAYVDTEVQVLKIKSNYKTNCSRLLLTSVSTFVYDVTTDVVFKKSPLILLFYCSLPVLFILCKPLRLSGYIALLGGETFKKEVRNLTRTY